MGRPVDPAANQPGTTANTRRLAAHDAGSLAASRIAAPLFATRVRSTSDAECAFSIQRGSHAFYVHRDRRKWPALALDDHVFDRRCILLEMIGLPVRFGRRGVVIDLEYEDVVRILLRDQDIELVAARLLRRGRSILLERRAG